MFISWWILFNDHTSNLYILVDALHIPHSAFPYTQISSSLPTHCMFICWRTHFTSHFPHPLHSYPGQCSSLPKLNFFLYPGASCIPHPTSQTPHVLILVDLSISTNHVNTMADALHFSHTAYSYSSEDTPHPNSYTQNVHNLVDAHHALPTHPIWPESSELKALGQAWREKKKQKTYAGLSSEYEMKGFTWHLKPSHMYWLVLSYENYRY